MGIDWDSLVIGPTMAAFGQGTPDAPAPIRYVSAQDGSQFSINGVFDEAYIEVQPEQGPPVATLAPVLGVQLSDFPPGIYPRQRDRFTPLPVNGVTNTYEVGNVEPDGHGWAMLTANLVEAIPL